MRLITSTAIMTLMAVPGFAETPKVVTDIAPVHSLVAQVMGELATPETRCARAPRRQCRVLDWRRPNARIGRPTGHRG